ncbi:type 1 glutamine amidotransferase domain-containing protein [Psychroserpens damuponensis]|uniref:type 1 glutamine amidotransferase domain-containing protein n=1 Tax=Psychroserpens damuponensis TaxID=943936 RepID=UPI00058E9A2D|nr:DJ-1/PfpI family protein [Psychroserpens damuponensis]
MFKKYRIIKWILSTIAIFIIAIVLLGVYISSLLSKDDMSLSNSHVNDIEYIINDVPSYRGKILAVVTSTDSMSVNGKATGYELTELARAYYVFQANGFDVEIASPLGGKPPVVIDHDDMGPFDYAFLNDSIAKTKTNNSIALKHIVPEDYKAVYFVGGKGAMFDFPDNTYIKALIKNFNSAHKVIGAVCHGPAALVNVKLENEQPFLKNKQVSSFTNNEELLLIPKAETIFPFLLQDKLIAEGAKFNEGIMYLEKVSHDGNLITGQNPWSVWALAETMVKQLGYAPKERERTDEEHGVHVLYIYETEGKKAAKTLITQMIQEEQKSISRHIIINHSAISVLKGDLGKCYDMISLAAHAKDLENKKL